jgi:hypothetical protein
MQRGWRREGEGGSKRERRGVPAKLFPWLERLWQVLDPQFRRAIQTGALSILAEDIKRAINAAYADVGKANHFLAACQPHPVGSEYYNRALSEAQKIIREVPTSIGAARDMMLKFLASE